MRNIHCGAAPAAAVLDPTIVIEADGDEDAKKTLKTLAFPTMDDDALPSSYAQKVLGSMAKWKVKMHSLISFEEEMEELPENMGSSFDLRFNRPSIRQLTFHPEMIVMFVVKFPQFTLQPRLFKKRLRSSRLCKRKRKRSCRSTCRELWMDSPKSISFAVQFHLWLTQKNPMWLIYVPRAFEVLTLLRHQEELTACYREGRKWCLVEVEPTNLSFGTDGHM